MDHGAWRAIPLWESGDVVSKSGVVNLVNKDSEESGGFITRVGLEMGVDLDDECRGDSREKTSLMP